MAPLVVARQLNKAKAFLDSILEKLPESEREAARSAYSAAQDEVSGIARELDTAIGTVNTTAERQAGWYTQHKDVIEGRTTNPNPINNAVDADKLTKELNASLTATRDELAGQGLYLSSVIPTIIAQHGVEFGEVLDGEALVNAALAAKTDIKTYYASSVKTRREEKAAATNAAAIAAAEERGRQAGIKEAGNGHIPYPVGGVGRTPTTLSGLRKPADATAVNPHSLDAAVQTAVEEMAKQAAR